MVDNIKEIKLQPHSLNNQSYNVWNCKFGCWW